MLTNRVSSSYLACDWFYHKVATLFEYKRTESLLLIENAISAKESINRGGYRPYVSVHYLKMTENL
jgi:hypothetical protein